MPALPRVPTVQLWHSEVPTLGKVILPDPVQRVTGNPSIEISRWNLKFRVADYSPRDPGGCKRIVMLCPGLK